MDELMQMIQQQKATNQNQAQGLPKDLKDPRMTETKELVAQHNGNAKEAFFTLLKEKAVNINNIFPPNIVNFINANK